MNVEYINPFLSATTSTFETMLGCTLVRGNPYKKNNFQPEHEVNGIIGLTGKAQETVVVSLSRDAALPAAVAAAAAAVRSANS